MRTMLSWGIAILLVAEAVNVVEGSPATIETSESGDVIIRVPDNRAVRVQAGSANASNLATMNDISETAATVDEALNAMKDTTGKALQMMNQTVDDAVQIMNQTIDTTLKTMERMVRESTDTVSDRLEPVVIAVRGKSSACSGPNGACRPGREEPVEVIGRGFLVGVGEAYICRFSLPDGSFVDSPATAVNEQGNTVECTFPKDSTGDITAAIWDASVALYEFGRLVRFVGSESYSTVSYQVEGPVISELDDVNLVLPVDGSAAERQVTVPFIIEDPDSNGLLTVTAAVSPPSALESGTIAEASGVDRNWELTFTPSVAEVNSGASFTVTITVVDYVNHTQDTATRSFKFTSEIPPQPSCYKLWTLDKSRPSGPYMISPDGEMAAREIYCDMTERFDGLGISLGGGWWVYQSNLDVSGDYRFIQGSSTSSDYGFYKKYLKQRWNDGSGEAVHIAWSVHSANTAESECAFSAVRFSNTYDQFISRCNGDNPSLSATWSVWVESGYSDSNFQTANGDTSMVRCWTLSYEGGSHIKRRNNGEHSPWWASNGKSLSHNGYMGWNKQVCGTKSQMLIR